MEAVEEWEEEREEECGSLKVRSRKSIIENLEANQGVVQVVQVVGESENGRNAEGNEGAPVVQAEVVRALRELESCVYLDREKGIESADEITGTKFVSVTLFTDEKKPANDEADFDTKNIEIQTGIPFVGEYGSPKHMQTENQSTLRMVFSEGQHEDGTAKFEPIMDRSSTNANGSLVDAGKIVVEMDVERVLEEQETHDLYCPNCNSCITKRVILRKRKRVVRDLKLDAKREEIQPSDDVESSPDADVANDLGHDVFRCLSCFSFFIPTATGFKLFPIFGRNNESPSSQSPQQTPTKNLNCISSIFEMFMGKLTGNEPAVVGRISPVTSGPSESKENVPTSVAPVLLEDTSIDISEQMEDDGTIRKWEILKSIVYGGLVESITSLGVVSSAAGSDATTLNIVALGVANLISGLIVILHSGRSRMVLGRVMIKRSRIDKALHVPYLPTRVRFNPIVRFISFKAFRHYKISPFSRSAPSATATTLSATPLLHSPSPLCP